MNRQIGLVDHMYMKLHKNVMKYANGNESTNYMNKNHGKTSIIRQITSLRQELMNLERMVQGLDQD